MGFFMANPYLGEFAGSMQRLVPPGQVSSTLRMRKRGAFGSMTLAIGDEPVGVCVRPALGISLEPM